MNSQERIRSRWCNSTRFTDNLYVKIHRTDHIGNKTIRFLPHNIYKYILYELILIMQRKFRGALWLYSIEGLFLKAAKGIN